MRKNGTGEGKMVVRISVISDRTVLVWPERPLCEDAKEEQVRPHPRWSKEYTLMPFEVSVEKNSGYALPALS